MNFSNKIIVVGSDHRNTLWIVRTLGSAGFKIYTIIVSNTIDSFVSKSKFVEKYWIVSDPSSVINVLNDNFLHELSKPIVYITNDICAKTIDENYIYLRTKFILPNIDDKQGLISYWMDKNIMVQAAEIAGFTIPKTWSLSLDDNDLNLPSNIIYPCIIKPELSSDGCKNDFRICNNKEELKISILKLKGVLSNVLIQEYIKPDYEVSIVGARLLMTKINIIPGLTYKISTCKSLHNLGMATYACLRKQMPPFINEENINNFFSIINYSGLYSIEFFIKGDKAYFIEINLRSDGNTFIPYFGGVNLPLLWAVDATGGAVNIMKQKISNDIYAMIEVNYFKYLRSYNPIVVIKDLFRTDCFSLFSLKDIKPVLYKIFFFLK